MQRRGVECLKALESGKNEDWKNSALLSVDVVDGIIYSLPSILDKNVPLSMNWFASDNIHLSKAGHFNVAAGIVSIFELEWQKKPDEPRLGNWDGGDHCFDFLRGKFLPEYKYRTESSPVSIESWRNTQSGLGRVKRLKLPFIWMDTQKLLWRGWCSSILPKAKGGIEPDRKAHEDNTYIATDANSWTVHH